MMEPIVVNQRARQIRATFQKCIERIRVVIVANKFLDFGVQELEVFETLFNNSFRQNVEDYRRTLEDLETASRNYSDNDFDPMLIAENDVQFEAEIVAEKKLSSGTRQGTLVRQKQTIDEPDSPPEPIKSEVAARRRRILSQQRTKFAEAVKKLAKSGITSHDVVEGVQLDPRKLASIKDLEKMLQLFSDQLERDPVEEAESKEKAKVSAERNRHHLQALEEADEEEKKLLARMEEERVIKLSELNKLGKQVAILNQLSAEKLEEKRANLAEEMEEKVKAACIKMAVLKNEQEITSANLEAQRNQQNREEEELIKIKRMMEEDLETFTKIYDQDMWAKQQEAEGLADHLKQQTKKLMEAQSSLENISSKYFRIVKEKQLEEEKRQYAIQEMERQIRAATIVQSIWRGFLVRRWFKKKKAKKMRRGRGTSTSNKGPRPGTAATSSGGLDDSMTYPGVSGANGKLQKGGKNKGRLSKSAKVAGHA